MHIFLERKNFGNEKKKKTKKDIVNVTALMWI